MRRYIPLLLALLLAVGTLGCDNLGDDCNSCGDDYFYDDYGYDYGYNQLQAADDFYQTSADTTIFVTDDNGVLINDLYSSASITFSESSSRGGQVLGNGDGSFSYTPPAGFSGTDSFVYVLSDNYSESAATVTITVNPSGTGGNPGASVIVDSATGNDATGSPFSTLGVAVTRAGANATIIVRPGNGQPYAGNVALLNGQQLIGQGFQNVTPQSSTRPVLGGNVDLANNNVIRGLSFQSTSGDAVNGDGSSGATISNCVFNNSSNNGRAVSGEQASGNWVIVGNNINRMADAGIRLTSSGSGTLSVKIDGNTITNCQLSAISLLSEQSSSFTASVTNNVMGGNDPGFTFDALTVGSSSFRLKLKGNTNDDVYLLSTFQFAGTFGVENLATLTQQNSSGTVTLDQPQGSEPITGLADGTINL